MQVLIAQQEHLSDLVALHHTLFMALHPNASKDQCQVQCLKRAHKEISAGISLLAYGDPAELPAHEKINAALAGFGHHDLDLEQILSVNESNSIQNLPHHQQQAATAAAIATATTSASTADHSADHAATDSDATFAKKEQTSEIIKTEHAPHSFLQSKPLPIPEVNDAIEYGSPLKVLYSHDTDSSAQEHSTAQVRCNC